MQKMLQMLRLKRMRGINSIGQITADTGIKTAVKTDLQNQANDKNNK